MQLVTVTFERVFDVVPGMRSRKEVTYFGFQSGAVRKVGVAAPGKPSLAEGSVITAYLLEPDNWQTLMGWVNHTSGEVAIESAAYEWFSIVWCTVMAFFVMRFDSSHKLLSIGIFSATVIWAIACIYSIYSICKVRATLERIKANGRDATMQSPNTQA